MEIRTHKYARLAYPLVEAIQVNAKNAKATLDEINIEQENAEQKKEIEELKKVIKLEAKYRTLALNFSTMIMQSGLAQAIGFLMAKGKDKAEHKQLLQHIVNLLEYDNIDNLHDVILQSNITDYQLLTRKALEASSWLKRYTQALLEKEGEKKGESND